MILLVSSAYAVDPNRAFSQYIWNQWNAETGFEGGQVNAFAQTPDGYLWIGTVRGLFRFDGVNFVSTQQLDPSSPSIAGVLGLTVDGDGSLWVWTQGLILRYRGGSFEDVMSLIPPGSFITAMGRGIDGKILFSNLLHGEILDGRDSFKSLAVSSLFQTAVVISLAQTTDGKVWIGTRNEGLLYLNEGKIQSVIGDLPDLKINSLLATKDGKLWIGTDNGLAQWNGSAISNDVPPLLRHVQISSLLADRDGNVWVGTSRGFLRFNAEGVTFQEPGKQSIDKVNALLEDREGNIWIGNTEGMYRLRDSPFVTYSVPEGMPSESNGPIYTDPAERTWFAPTDGGLYWIKNGVVTPALKKELGNDVVYSISGNRDDLWIGRQRGGLTHVVIEPETKILQTFTQANGLAENSVYTVRANSDGTVWAGTLSGGVSRLQDGIFTNYTTANGLASNSIEAIQQGNDGTMWFATRSGLSALSQGRWKTYTTRDGLPSNDLISLLKDSDGNLWIGTASGLAVLNANAIRSFATSEEILHEPILGLAEDYKRTLWISTASHVVGVNRDKLLIGEMKEGDVREYSVYDGLHGTEGVRRDRSVITDRRGRIWFSLSRGVSVVNPLRSNGSVSAIPHIESVSKDGKPIPMQRMVRITGPSQRVAFTYTGLNLAVPERIRFRYRLDGFDQDWSESTSARQAVYTNLAPGSYSFRVTSSNSDGAWDGAEAVLPLKIDPAFWQAWWFRITSLLTLSLLLWTVYRLRIGRLSRQMQLRLEDRLEERERIARDLHDTLLQGIFSASLHLEIIEGRLPENAEIKPLVQQVLELTRKAGKEGRSTIRRLRSSHSCADGLEEALSQIQKQFPAQKNVEFHVVAEGEPQPLRAWIRDDVYSIGREGVINAFRHSHATRIEVEVEYASRHLRMMVRDNGQGIDEQMLRTGREGHWGLTGMRERARKIGAKFEVMSRVGAGTEIQLLIPAKVAFESNSSGLLAKWFNRETSTDRPPDDKKERQS